MSAGWALLVHDRGLTERDRQRITEAGHPITTITTDIRSALLLVGSGQCGGLVVTSYAVLSPAVVELLPDRPGQRPRLLGGGEAAPLRVPETRPVWSQP